MRGFVRVGFDRAEQKHDFSQSMGMTNPFLRGPMTDPLPKMIGPDELATLLRRTPQTLKVDARRRPHTLPPRFEIPGTNRLMWLESDVVEWIETVRVQSKAKHRLKADQATTTSLR